MTKNLTAAQERRLQKLKSELFLEQTKKAQTRGYKTKSGNQVTPVTKHKAVQVKRKAKK